MRLFGGLVLGLLAILFLEARASVPEQQGTPLVGFGAIWRDVPTVGRPARLRFSMAGSYDTTASGTAHVRLPQGIRLISGDTLHRGHPQGRSKYWSIVVVADRPGQYEITGTLVVQVTQPEAISEELDLSLPFQVRNDAADIQASSLTRSETVRAGKRFRYAGKYLVPLEIPEKVTQDNIERVGKKAVARTAVAGACGDCDRQGVVDVPFVVFLNPQGQVTDAHPLRSLQPSLERAARKTLGGWKFDPSQYNGRAVSDWLEIEVSVNTEF